MKRFKLILMISLMLTLFFSVNLHAKGKSQKIKGQAKINLRSAKVYAQQKNVDKALDFYLKVVVEYPDHVESLFNIAGIYNNEALDDYQKADELYELSAKYYNKTIQAIESIPDWESYEHFPMNRKEASKMLKNQWNRIFKNAYDLFQEAKYDESETILKKLVNETPDSLNVYQVLAAIEGQRGNNEKQLEYFNILLEKEPNNQNILINIADQYYQARNFEKAIEYYQKLIEIDPNNIDYLYFAGMSYLYSENNIKSLEYFEQILALEPENVDALNNAAYIAQSEHNDEKATDYLTRLYEAEKIEDNLSTLCYHLAKVQKWNDLLNYAKQWYELDDGNKNCSVAYPRSNTDKNTALQKQYTTILKKMQ